MSARQTIVSAVLLSAVYVSNVIFTNKPTATTTVRRSTHGLDVDVVGQQLDTCYGHGYTFLDYIYALGRGDTAAGKFMYSSELGKHCRTKLNLTVTGERSLLLFDEYVLDNVRFYEGDGIDLEISKDARFDIQPVERLPAQLTYFNRTSILLSFAEHEYDDAEPIFVSQTIAAVQDDRDVVGGGDSAAAKLSVLSGFTVYTVMENGYIVILFVSDRPKLYYIHQRDEQRRLFNTGGYDIVISRLLRHEADCIRYVDCFTRFLSKTGNQ